jgi:hypothetical protein
MDRSKLSLFLFILISNYFLTFLIIGLIAGLISLLNKPRPLKINTVGEALFSYYMLFTIGLSNLVKFVFHVFFGDTAAKFIGWGNKVPFKRKWDSQVSVSALLASLHTKQVYHSDSLR